MAVQQAAASITVGNHAAGGVKTGWNLVTQADKFKINLSKNLPVPGRPSLFPAGGGKKGAPPAIAAAMLALWRAARYISGAFPDMRMIPESMSSAPIGDGTGFRSRSCAYQKTSI
jgi:hypothetical protein